MNESTIELAALSWLVDIGFATAYGPDLASDGQAQERESFGDVLLLNEEAHMIEYKTIAESNNYIILDKCKCFASR